MIITSKAYKAGDVVSFKLTTGEEMLARTVEDNADHFVIAKPVNLVPGPTGGVGMIPSLVSADVNSNISLQKSSVILHSATRKEVADEYIKATTGIKPASSLAGFNNGKSSTQR